MAKSRIKLSDHFTYRRLVKFVLPSVAMMIFVSIYGIVDGLFVSNFVGKTALAAINLIIPLSMMLSAIGFMVGTGGSALVAMQLGEGKKELASRTFSMLIIFLFIVGVVLAVISFVFMPQIVHLLGAKAGEFEDFAILYGRITSFSLPFFMLQNAFQSFMVVAEKPKHSLKITVAAGLTNMVLDYVFIVIFKWGIAGAAIATVIAEVIGGVVPFIYFSSKNTSTIKFVPAKFSWTRIWATCTNGVSEFLTNVAGSVVGMLYNMQLLKYIGEDGVAAYGIIMYLSFIFSAIFFGYMIGSAPLFSYNHASANHEELHNLYDMSIKINAALGITMAALSFVFAPLLSTAFARYDQNLLELTIHGMRIMSVHFLFMGFAVFGSGFFTALGNGFLSALLAFMRTIVFQVSALFILPLIMGIDGIWWSGPVASIMIFILTVIMLKKNRTRYHY